MGDVTLAQSVIEAVTSALAVVGDTRTLRVVAYGSVDPSDPGAGGSQTIQNFQVEALLYEYDERLRNGTTVLDGDRRAIIDLAPLTQLQIADIQPGQYVIDGSETYTIVNVDLVEVAGLVVTAVLQLRGA